LCKHISGADLDAITKAIGADRRISSHYFQGGLAFGGTCFPRDTRAYITLADKYGVQTDIIRAVEEVNRYQNQHLAEVVLREMEELDNKAVGVLGLAFTLNTPAVTDSPSLKLIAELLKHDLRVVAYDPLAIDNTKAVFGSAIEYVHSAESCLAQAGLAVVTLRYPELKQSVEGYTPTRPLTVVDCWRMIDPAPLNKQIRYIALGRAAV
jgi:UDPglucose 6-dehydrogenase